MGTFSLQEVLGEEKSGAEILILTRGSYDTLSLSDEKTIQEYINYYQVGHSGSNFTFSIVQSRLILTAFRYVLIYEYDSVT